MNTTESEVRITFLVTVPANTPKDDTIYIIGSHSKLNNWFPKGVPLTKVSSRQYQISFTFPKDIEIEYKFSRGTWKTVEKDFDFYEQPNRKLHTTKGKIITAKIKNWADKINLSTGKRPCLRGYIKMHKKFKATKLDNERTIWVYLPPSYRTNKNKLYPVLYAHDGNNMFYKETAFLGVEWELDDTTEYLISKERIREIIIVAIENTQHRDFEYTHVYVSQDGGGKADHYADFIMNDLKPFIDKKYRTLKDRQYTGILGSSLGGLVSLYMTWKYPNIFSMAGVVSPSVWWANRDILEMVQRTKKKPPIKIWLDIGTYEGEHKDAELNQAVLDTRELRDALIDKGFRMHFDLEYLEAEGAEHNEASWAQRVDKILLYFFGARSSFATKTIKI